MESVSFCPERGRFVVGGEDMYAHLYDYETGNELECNRGALVLNQLTLSAAHSQSGCCVASYLCG